jgi:GNAT superfamily N-acetyltransferase
VQNACRKRDDGIVITPVPEADITAFTERDTRAVQRLFAEYAESLEVDLGFQAFDEEVAALPGRYAPPRGALLVARVDGEAVGCVGIRPLEAEACELKRLFVRPAHRSGGTGRRLLEEALATARRIGYRTIRLDTIPGMERAQTLYARAGFREIAPYTANPVAGTRYLELEL